MLTIRQAASRARVHHNTIRAWIRDGVIKADLIVLPRQARAEWQVDPESLREWLQQRCDHNETPCIHCEPCPECGASSDDGGHHEWPSGGVPMDQSPTYRVSMKDAGRGHLLR